MEEEREAFRGSSAWINWFARIISPAWSSSSSRYRSKWRWKSDINDAKHWMQSNVCAKISNVYNKMCIWLFGYTCMRLSSCAAAIQNIDSGGELTLCRPNVFNSMGNRSVRSTLKSPPLPSLWRERIPQINATIFQRAAHLGFTADWNMFSARQ